MATKTPKAHVSKEKIKAVSELAKAMSASETVMLVSIKSLPARQFQKIKKSLSGKAGIQVVKKRALERAIDETKKDGIAELKKYVKEDMAVITSNIEAFELSEMLGERKSPMKAKPGQISTKSIEIEAGVTELPAGPAVSELGALGLQVKVTGGKIEIIKPKVIVKEGEPVSDGAASVMSKLNILPFSVGFIPLIAYEAKSKKIFTSLIVDKKGVLEELKTSFAKSKMFAANIGYISHDTIGLMIAKAGMQEKALEQVIDKHSQGESK